MTDNVDLQRFLDAQSSVYPRIHPSPPQFQHGAG